MKIKSGGKISLSTVGDINYYLLFMIDYCKRGRDDRRFLYTIKIVEKKDIWVPLANDY